MSKATVPTHIAIIMDGNGRWAQSRGEQRLSGHRAGAKTVREIVTYCAELGVKHLTLYAFSSENWRRPEKEVGGLMQLLKVYLEEEENTLQTNSIKLSTIGDTSKLPFTVRTLLKAVMARTKKNDHMQLTLALSYGARDEMRRAVQSLATRVADGDLEPEAITEAHISDALDTANTPDPDLIIRTSGEMRLSNFLLWQAAYAELYVTDEAWPAFSRESLDKALASFAGRERRFGKTGAQVAPGAPA